MAYKNSFGPIKILWNAASVSGYLKNSPTDIELLCLIKFKNDIKTIKQPIPNLEIGTHHLLIGTCNHLLTVKLNQNLFTGTVTGEVIGITRGTLSRQHVKVP